MDRKLSEFLCNLIIILRNNEKYWQEISKELNLFIFISCKGVDRLFTSTVDIIFKSNIKNYWTNYLVW